MVTPEQTTKLLAFLASHPVAVIATATPDAVPAAAVVLYTEQDDLTLIFATHPTRKHKNLTANPATAFAITKGMQAVQMHGMSAEAADQESAKATFLAKHPEMDAHLVEGSIFYLFTPSWIRYMDYGAQPREAWEVTIG